MHIASSRRTVVAFMSLLAAAVLVAVAGFSGLQSAGAEDHIGEEFAVAEKDDEQIRIHDLTWNASTGQYLAVWSEHPDHTSTEDGEVHSGDDDIVAALVDLDRTVGSEFVVSEGGGSKDFPAVAHSHRGKDPNEGDNDRPSLVVWSDGGNIASQVVTAGGGKVGGNVELAGGDDLQTSPGIAYGEADDVFLVVWEQVTEDDGGTLTQSNVQGRLVHASGGSAGDPVDDAFTISDDTDGRAAAPTVAYDEENETFLVVWGDDRGGHTEERDIWGQRIDTDGNREGGNFAINEDTGLQRAPRVVHHPERDQDEFLVTWNSLPGGFGSARSAHAQRVTGDGSLRGGRIDLGSGSESVGTGTPTVNRDTGRYVIPLNVERESVDVVQLGLSGNTPILRETVSSNTSANKGRAVAAYGATTRAGDGDEVASDVLLAWRDSQSGSDLTDQNLRARTVDGLRDTDGDGIPDRVEINGILDAEGNVLTDMEALGANPCRETIAVEVDYMVGDGHSHEPNSAAIDEIVEAFDNAPRSAVPADECPYPDYEGSDDGIDFIVIIDDELEHQDVLGTGDKFGDVREDNFTPEHRPYFHYNPWVHDSKENSSRSGVCCHKGGFIVSLGSWTPTNGTTRQQSGTMMHELGHALGLGHGGGDGANRKPNYLSVMSYSWQTKGILREVGGDFAIDYSDEELDDLDETKLVEADGLSGTSATALWTKWRDGSFSSQSGFAEDEADWNGNGDITESALGDPVDINNDSVCVKPDDGTLDTEEDDLEGDDIIVGNRVRAGENRTCETEAHDDDEQRRPVGWEEPNPLEGYDDWANITFRATMAPGADLDHIEVDEEDELTFEEAEQIREEHEQALDGDVAVTKTASVDSEHPDGALPGDTIEYAVTVESVGEGDATEVVVTDTLPDGAEQTFDVGELASGEEEELTLEYEVPTDTFNGTELTNVAEATAKNAAGQDEENTDNNDDSAAVTVYTPVMELEKDADAQIQAGEAITYELTYENSGGATAHDVTIEDTLPEDVYYSKALDDGDGPEPNEVERHEDGTTLTFELGTVNAGDEGIIEFEARPTLLAVEGDTFENTAEVLTYEDANGNEYDPVDASATTSIAASVATEDPEGLGFWRNQEEHWTDETLARIQATDPRWDENGNGVLDGEEVEDVLAPGGGMPNVLEHQLIAVYFNLAERRIVASTEIDSDSATRLGLDTVADAVIFATDTLSEELQRGRNGNQDVYSDATDVLADINENVSPVY